MRKELGRKGLKSLKVKFCHGRCKTQDQLHLPAISSIKLRDRLASLVPQRILASNCRIAPDLKALALVRARA